MSIANETTTAPAEAVNKVQADADEKIEASEASEEQSNQEGIVENENESHQDEKDEEKKPGNGFKKRIDKLNRKVSDRDREIEYWKKVALDKKADDRTEPSAPKKETKEGKPRAEDFDSHSEYIEALTDWKVDDRDKKAEEKKRNEEIRSEYQTRQKSFAEKVSAFKKSHDDFDDVMESVDDIPMSLGVQEAILQSDIGPDLMYQLAKNREECERINKLSPIAAAREIGKIEARLSSSQEKSKEQIQTTKAPKPLNPVKANASFKRSINDPDIPFADYVRLRREGKISG